MFYDTADKIARKAISVSPNNTLYALGVFKDAGSDSYAYRIDGTTTWRNSGVERTDGWHEFKWVFSDEGLKVYIDDTFLAENANVKNYSKISILSRGGWSQADHDNNFGIDNVRTWLDEKYEAKDRGLTIIPKEFKYYTTSIKVDQSPNKQEYDYDFSEPGIQTVTVKYNELNADQEEITFTAEVKVRVTEEPIDEDSYYTTSIRVDRNPDKQVYVVGDEFEPEGMKVSALQKASPSDAVRAVELDLEELEYEFDFSESGIRTVTISYNELNADQEEKTFTAKVKVRVTEEPIEEDSYYTTKIKVDKKPDKLVYYVDDEFEPEGMKVSALQKASPSNVVRTVELDPGELEYVYDFTTSGKKKVKIVYYGMDKNQEEKKFTAELVVTVGIPWTPIEPSKPSRPSHGSGSSSGSSASVQGTWKQDAAGWYFTYTSGAYAADKWESIGNTWYYFDHDGYMATEWQYINNNWYYMDPLSGAMTTGWHLDTQDGYWYYLNPATGAVMSGWQQVGDNWYYLNEQVPEASWKFDETSKQWLYEKQNILPYGAMYRNTTTPDGYQVDSNGIWIK